MELSFTNICVLFFLSLIILWLFVRPGEPIGDRLFLIIAAMIYVVAGFSTFWIFKNKDRSEARLIVYEVLEAVGFGLVMLSRKFFKKKPD